MANITDADAQYIANSFVADVIGNGKEWSVADLEELLPPGWCLEGIEKMDLDPPTADKIAGVIGNYACRGARQNEQEQPAPDMSP